MKSNSIYIALLIFIISFSSCQEKTPQTTESIILLETTKSWNGDLLPKFPEGQPKVTITKIVIPPKTKLPKHLHPVITTGIVTKGKLTITDVNNQQKIMKAGDVLVEVSNTIHFGENTGSETLEIIVFYIGNENSPNTILAEK
tara:strand:- start:1703 stop:2131 length:429 start_codon:yes stop_codon:yes gene_type:complete